MELARLLGYANENAVYRHEHATNVPPLLTALAYEATFGVPVSELFPGCYQTIKQSLEKRIVELEAELQQKSGKGRNASATAQKLEWIVSRRNGFDA
jgi:hypothetical protein